jgi:hypothetical protein
MRIRWLKKGRGRNVRFAWLPKKLANGTIIWLESYRRYNLYCDYPDSGEREERSKPARGGGDRDEAAPASPAADGNKYPSLVAASGPLAGRVAQFPADRIMGRGPERFGLARHENQQRGEH